MTTAITSPHSENGKRFWTALNMKNKGFNKDNISGYQYNIGKRFPYQFQNSEDVPGYVKIKDFAFTRNQTQSFKHQVSGMSKFITSKIKLQKHMTVDREKMRYDKLESCDEIIDNSKDDIHNLVDAPEMNKPKQNEDRNIYTETKD